MTALAALSRSYSTRGNVPHPDNSSQARVRAGNWWMLLCGMQNLLTGGTLGGTRHANSVWTMDHSCDSTTAGTPGDAVDRLGGGTFNFAKFVLAASGSAHSWAVLYNATLGIYCCLDMNNGTTAGRIAFSKVNFSGGTTTTGPTSTTEWTMGSTVNGSSISITLFADDTAGNTNYGHYTTTNTGEFWFGCTRASLGVFSTFVSLWGTTGPETGDTRNQFAVGHSVSSGRGAMNFTAVSITPNTCTGRTPNNSAVQSVGGLGSYSFGGTAYVGAYGAGSISGNYNTWDVPVMCLNGGQVTRRGLLTDWYWIGTAAVGDSYPSTGAQERVVVGDMILPFNSVNPVM